MTSGVQRSSSARGGHHPEEPVEDFSAKPQASLVAHLTRRRTPHWSPLVRTLVAKALREGDATKQGIDGSLAPTPQERWPDTGRPDPQLLRLNGRPRNTVTRSRPRGCIWTAALL